jgi:hypothetical protein
MKCRVAATCAVSCIPLWNAKKELWFFIYNKGCNLYNLIAMVSVSE